MDTSKHTPGPWTISPSHVEDVDIVEIRTIDERLLAEVLPYDTLNGMAEMDANARLIAAAPDLLEALQALHELAQDKAGGTFTLAQVFGLDPDRNWTEAEGTRALDAIAKATQG